MRVLIVKSAKYVCDEDGVGRLEYPAISPQMFSAGAYLRRRGFDVSIIDAFDDTVVPYDEADVVISWVALITGFYDEIRYLENAKAAGKTTVMVMNDPFEGIEHEVMAKYPSVDYCVRQSDREGTLERLLGLLGEGRRPGSDFAGLIFRGDDGRLVDTGRTPSPQDLSFLPSVADEYRRLDLSRYDHGAVEVGRGCPFACTFCFYNKTRLRRRRYEHIVEEMEVLAPHFRTVFLDDLNFLANKRWALGLADAIIASGVHLPWATDVRMEQCVDRPTLERLKASGCYEFTIGLESCDEAIREKIDKRVPDAVVPRALETCLEVGIDPAVNLMIGFPWDTHETLEKMDRFLDRYPYCRAIQYVRPLRGTPLYDEYLRLGLLERELTLEDYVHSKEGPVTRTLALSKGDLVEWYTHLQNKMLVHHVNERLRDRGIVGSVKEVLTKKSLAKGIDIARRYVRGALGLGRPAVAR